MTVVNLADYKRPSKAEPRTNTIAPRFVCMRCDGDTFRLRIDGDVNCANCGSRMRNLLISSLYAVQP